MCSCDPEEPHRTKADDGHRDRNDEEATAQLRQRHEDRRHFWSTLGLCGSSFSMFYLIMNVFPYSGFMALHLLHKQQHQQEQQQLAWTASTIGPWAGILASSFRLGRIPTAIAWGRCADRYGRKPTLVIGLAALILGNLGFGLAPTLGAAVGIRFVTGLWNGTMVVVRTMVTEIARGNPRLESRGVAMVSSVSGYAMLLGPAVGGLLSDPLRQYSDYFDRVCGHPINTRMPFLCRHQGILEDYPFLLPNVVGSMLAVVSLGIVLVCVEESLPPDQLRDWRCIPTDLASWMASWLVWNGNDASNEKSSAPLAMDENNTSEATPLVSSLDEETLHKSKPNRPRTLGEATAQKSVLAMFLDSSTHVRYFFYSMWSFAFTSLASVEAFPLFAMAPTNKGGLGWDETRIGLVQTVGGCVFVACQYKAFAAARNRLGTLEAMRMSALSRSLLRLGFPLALYISTPWNDTATDNNNTNNNNDNNWLQLGYLGVITGWLSILGSIFMGCATMGVNACIQEANQRASMNGLQSMVASLGRGLGPIVAGYLVAHAMTSGRLSATTSAWVVYGVLMALEAITYWTTRRIPEDGGNAADHKNNSCHHDNEDSDDEKE